MGSSTWLSLLVASCAILGHASADFLKIKSIQDAQDAEPSSHLVMAKSIEDDMDLLAEESSASVASTPYPEQEPRYKFPFAYAFNGGKPFSLEKDPITGKIDFEKTPPLKALELNETYVDEQEQASEDAAPLNDETARIDYGKFGYVDSKPSSKNERVGPNEINPYSPSFHDFLNLPVRYSSEKYEREKYPLISSSYANTKVQSGQNSYNINNHRPTYHQETATKVSISTATRKIYYPKSTSTMPTTTSTTTSTTTTTTTPKPVTMPPSTTRMSTTTTTTTTTTPRPRTTTTTTTTMKPTTIKLSTTISSTRAPIITTNSQPPAPMRPRVTTYKPTKSSSSRYDEYEEMLPIEKLQGSSFGTKEKFGNYPTIMDHKELNGHNNGPQSPNRPIVPSMSYDYSDGYEDYENPPEEQPSRPEQEIHKTTVTTTYGTPSTTRGVPSTTTTKMSTPMTSQSVTTSGTTPTSPVTFISSSTYHHSMPTIMHMTTKHPMMHQTPPAVTSMPLDTNSGMVNLHHPLPPVHENFVEVHKQPQQQPDFIAGSVHFPSGSAGNVYGRPGSVISVLPESTSNVIVPHDQDTVSFVLGNRQNVEGSYYTHGSSQEESPHPGFQPPNENNFRPIFGAREPPQQQQPQQPQGPGAQLDQKVSVAMPSVAVVDGSSQQNPNFNGPSWGEVKPQSTFVFPPENGQNEAGPPPPPKDEVNLSGGFVSFPEKPQDKPEFDSSIRPVEEHVIVINQADGSVKEMINPPVGHNGPPSDSGPVVFGSSNGNVNPNLPQLSESLTPPAEPSRQPQGGPNQRPPYYFNYQHGPSGGPGNQPRPPQRIPLPPRQKGPEQLPPPGFKRRPPPPPQDGKLPNILPQFRPNAKTSHGHRGTDKIGTLPAPPQYANRPRPHTQSPPSSPHPHPHPHPPPHPSRRPQNPHSLPPPHNPAPSHFQRLSPPPPPPPNHPQHPPPHPSHPPALRKKEDAPVPPPEHIKRYSRPASVSSNNVHRPVALKLRMEDELGADRFSAEPPQVPPRPIIFPKTRGDNQLPKVATLQMIQQRGGLDDEIIRSGLPPVLRNKPEDKDADNSTSSDDSEQRKDNSEADRNPEGGSEAGPVYVVYPVSSGVNIGSQEDLPERDESVVIGTRGPHRPLPPDTLPHDEDDDDDEKNEDEKLAGYLYGKRPHHNAVNSDFDSPQGYPHEPSLLVREKPILVPSEELEANLKKAEEANSSDSSSNLISYLQDFFPFSKKTPPASSTISATLPRLPLLQSSSPIAYVYTPTTPASSVHRFDEDDDDESIEEEEEPVLKPHRHRDEKPVLLPSQQPSSSSSSAPSPQNFMAPFVASVSAEMPAKNGWSVVAPAANGTERTKEEEKQPQQPQQQQQQQQSKEAQDKKDHQDSAENEAQTEKSTKAAEGFDPDNFKPQLFGGFKPIYEFPVEEDDQVMVGRKGAGQINVNADAGRRFL